RAVTLMTRQTRAARRIAHVRLAVRTVVADDLKLEAAGRFVVADDLDDRAALLVADEEPVLERRARIARRSVADDRGHCARRLEEVRIRGAALQRAAERNQHRSHV